MDCEDGLFEIGLLGALDSISIPQLKGLLFVWGKYSDGEFYWDTIFIFHKDTKKCFLIMGFSQGWEKQWANDYMLLFCHLFIFA